MNGMFKHYVYVTKGYYMFIDIPGYEGLYKVSPSGEILSLSKHGRPTQVLKPVTNDRGYKQCMLRKNGRPKSFYVHRLIAQVFIPNPDNRPFINHINFDRGDNRVENLEWVTPRENIIHSLRNGRYDKCIRKNMSWLMTQGFKNKGINHGQSKLTEQNVLDIRRYFESGTHPKALLARMFNVSYMTITHIVRREQWKHI